MRGGGRSIVRQFILYFWLTIAVMPLAVWTSGAFFFTGRWIAFWIGDASCQRYEKQQNPFFSSHFPC